LTLTSRILGFLRDAVIASFFGADAATDAFFVAFRIPNFLRRLFAEGSFSQAFVPVLTSYKENSTQQSLHAFLSRLAGSLAAVLAAATSVGILAAPLLVLCFAPGFARNGELFMLSTDMVRITFPYLFLITLTAFAAAILNTYRRFAVPAFTPVFLNLTMIAAAIWMAPFFPQPIYALAWGVLIAGLIQLAFQLPFLARLKMLPRLHWGFRDPGVRRVIKLLGPAVVGVSVTQVNVLLNTLIASFLGSGSVSWLYYSDRVVEFPVGIFGVAIGTVMLPHLARSHAHDDPTGFSRSLDSALRGIFLVALPATVGLALLAKPMLCSLFQYRHFSAYDAEMTSRSLITYSSGLIGFVAARILMSGFTARHDYRTPFRFSLYAIIINLAMSVALVYLASPFGWGHAALALSTAIAGLANAGLLLAGLLRAGIYCPSAGWGLFLARVAGASCVMGSLLVQINPGDGIWQAWQPSQRIGHLTLFIAAGMTVYAGSLLLSGLRPAHLMAQRAL